MIPNPSFFEDAGIYSKTQPEFIFSALFRLIFHLP